MRRSRAEHGLAARDLRNVRELDGEVQVFAEAHVLDPGPDPAQDLGHALIPLTHGPSPCAFEELCSSPFARLDADHAGGIVSTP